MAPLANRNLINGDDVAKLCRVSRGTWDTWVRSGHAPRPIRLGPRLIRFDADEVSAWLDRQQAQ